jgi:hypothetical protein
MGIESVLKAGIKSLPDSTKVKGQQLPNALKKMGVKDEELKFSGIEIQPDKSYTKADLEELEAGRKDKFGKETKQGGDTSYSWVSLEPGVSNPTYKENVYTMADKGVEGSRYTSSHFPDVPNYLMHTRTYDDTVDGTPTRVLQEIQSDLHQEGRAQGYDMNLPKPSEADKAEAIRLAPLEELDEITSKKDFAKLDDLLDRFGYTQERMEELDIPIYEALADIGRGITASSSNVPTSPYEKSWLAKGIERELDSAIEDGRQQLAIPISGEGIDNLKRADGVQKWYEGNVVNTAKKIAKQNGMDFEVKTVGAKKVDLEEFGQIVRDYRGNLDNGVPAISAYDGSMRELDNLGLSEGEAAAFLEGVRANQTLAELVKDFEGRLGGGTQYAVIKPKGERVPMLTPEEFEELETFKASLDLKSEAAKARVKDIEEYIAAGKFKAERPNLKLYSSPAAAVAAGYASYQAGGTDDDVRVELGEAGYDNDEIDEIIGDAKFAYEAVTVYGDPEEEVMAFFKGKETEIADVKSVPIDQPVEKSFWERAADTLVASGYDAYEVSQDKSIVGTPTAKRLAYGTVVNDEGVTAEQLVTSLQVIQPNMSSITTRASGYFGNETAFKKAEAASKAAAQKIVNLAQEKGITIAFQPNLEPDGMDQLMPDRGGHWFVQMPDGTAKPLDFGFWESIKAESGEITLGIGGAVAGAKAAAKVTKNPWLVGAGSVAGAMFGAVAGTEIDYLRESIALHEEMEAGIAAHKALTAAEASVIGDLVAYPLVKGSKEIWNGVKSAKDFILDGNTQGAHRALKETMFMSDSEVADITIGLERATKGAPAVKPLEANIRAVALTQPGGEAIVKAAASIDPQASAAVAKSIDTRAKDVLETTASLTNENVGRVLVADLSNYTSAVRQQYGDVKDLVAKSPRINDFAWDYEKLAIKPVLETLRNNIMDPAVLERFKLQQQAINNMSDSRTLTDLIELRQLVNDFRFNKRITKSKDFDALNKVIANVDGAIKVGAEAVMEQPKEWLASFAKAKADYAKMKQLEKNVIYRALNRPGLTEKSVAQALTKYITSLDGSFQDVMTQLPLKSREIAEGSVINTLAEKFAAGTEGGQRAMHFPLLAKELDKVTFTTKEARQAKIAIKDMAEVFKNEIPLSQSTGNIQIPHFQSYLTADPVVRAKFEIASGMFNYIKRLAPTASQRNMALVTKTAKLIEQPLNAKAMREVMSEVSDPILLKQITDMQQAAAQAKAAGDVGSAKITLYGDGQVLSAKGKGAEVKIPVHRIATYDIQNTIANKYGVDINDKVGMTDALIAEGYMAVQQGTDKVRRLK